MRTEGKRLLAVLLALSMIISMTSPAHAETTEENVSETTATTEQQTVEEEESSEEESLEESEEASSDEDANQADGADEEESSEEGENSSEEEEELTGTLEAVTADDEDLPDNDELLEGYIEEIFEEQLPEDSDSSAVVCDDEEEDCMSASLDTVTEEASETCVGETALTGTPLEIYTQLKTAVAKIASGEESSNSVSLTDVTEMDGLTWTWDDLGLTYSSSLSEDEIKAAVKAKMTDALSTEKIHSCLLTDCPYDLYWYDKTTGMSTSYNFSYNSSKVYITSLTYTFAIAEGYQAEDDSSQVDTSMVETAKTAAANAAEIVEEYASDTDLEKLTAYKETICDLVTYDSDYSSKSYGDTWQLVYVFDGDEDTNVVCEGYSKAFKYLCDLSEFDNAECYTVYGTMNGGSHMWNLVSLDDVIYLADITNSDSGTIGQNGGLFLVSADDESVSDSSATGYTVTISSTSLVYVCDDKIIAVYPESWLTLGNAYDLSIYTLSLAETSVTYNGTAQEPAVTVANGSTVLEEDTDYTVEYSDNTDVGTATVTVTGAGDYTGTLQTTFSITPADPELTASIASSSLTYGETTSIKASATSGGDITYTSGDTSVATIDSDSEGNVTATATGAGEVTITVEVAATDNYSAASQDISLSVSTAEASVTLTAAATSLTYGESTTLKISSTSDGAISYTSSDTSVVTVNSEGVVTATGAGSATITATAEETTHYASVSDSITVTVSRASTTLTLTAAATSLTYGESTTLKVSSTSDGAISYTSSDTSVVTVDSQGVVTTTGVGTATITATSKETTHYASASDSLTMTVSKATPKVTFDSGTVNISYGETATVTASSTSGSAITYTSSNASVAAVNSSSGAVTATGVGTATITATAAATDNYTSASASITVTVSRASATLTLSAGSTSLVCGGSTTLSAASSYGGTITYTSSDTSVVTVTSAGKVTAIGVGTATITASTAATTNYEAASASVKITVTLAATSIKSLTNTKSGVKLTWKKISGASGYYIYRKVSGGSYSKIKKITSGSTTSYTDTKVKSKNGKKYTYYVVAYAGSARSSYTKKTIVRLVAPTVKSATNSSSKKVVVKWAKKSKITGYQIQYSTSSKYSNAKTVTVSAKKTSRTLTGLKKGKTYYIRIRTYKKVSGKKYYSAWTSTKVKIRK